MLFIPSKPSKPLLTLLPLSNLQEHLALSVVTANKTAPKSEIDWTVDYCFTGDASNSANVAALFDGAHSGAFANIEAILAEN
jgi:hypothetical protein